MKRDDENFLYAAVWEYGGKPDTTPILHKEDLIYRDVQLKQRSYK